MCLNKVPFLLPGEGQGLEGRDLAQLRTSQMGREEQRALSQAPFPFQGLVSVFTLVWLGRLASGSLLYTTLKGLRVLGALASGSALQTGIQREAVAKGLTK